MDPIARKRLEMEAASARKAQKAARAESDRLRKAQAEVDRERELLRRQREQVEADRELLRYAAEERSRDKSDLHNTLAPSDEDRLDRLPVGGPFTLYQEEDDEYKECPDCAEEIKAAACVCRYCGWETRERQRSRNQRRAPRARSRLAYGPRKSAGTAMLLAFLLVGAGHFYTGEAGRGVFFLLFAIGIWFGALVFGAPILMLGSLVLYVAQIVDAGSSASRVNRAYF